MASIYTNYNNNGRFRLDYSVSDLGNKNARVSWAVYFEYTKSGWINTQGIQLWMNGHHLIDQANTSSSRVSHYNGDWIAGSTYDLGVDRNGNCTVSWNLQGNVYSYPDNRNCKTNNGYDDSATASIGTKHFNMNILLPDGTEPWQTGEAGSVEEKSDWDGDYVRVYDQRSGAYVKGTGVYYRNFSPGTGLKLSSVSGLSPNNTSGPWSVTQGDDTTVSFQTAWQTYKVTLDQQGGSGGTTSVNIVYNTKTGSYPSITLPSRSGYTFGGYYTGTGGSGTQYYNASGNSVRDFKIASNTTWYAYWIPLNYSLTINPNGGTYDGSTSSKTITQAFNTTYTLKYPTKNGYMFSHWSASRGSNFDENGLHINVYNNMGNGTVTHTWMQSEASSGTNGDVLKIVTNGTASPGAGGFYQAFQTQASHTYYQIYRLKVPVGYTVSYANNAMGDSPVVTKFTNMAGTGDWKTYIFRLVTTGTGTFSTSGFVYLNGSDNTSVTWYVAQAQVWDATDGVYRANSNGIYRFDFSASNCTLTANWVAVNNAYVNVNGTWRGGLVYVNVNGTWKQAEAVYVNVNGTWKQSTG